jgi:HK97 gp10 family phage protein
MSRAEVDIQGIDDVIEILNSLAPTRAKSLMRTTVHGVAAKIRDKAKANIRSSAKDSGTLVKAVKAYRHRAGRNYVSSSVVVTTGNSVKNNAWYWRFTEYGTKTGVKEIAWGRRAAQEVKPSMDMYIKSEFTVKLKAALKRAQKLREKK